MDFWDRALKALGGSEGCNHLLEPAWKISPIAVERFGVKREFSIVTGDIPLLKIEDKDEHGGVIATQTMNLPAIDDFIGQLIKHRDILAGLQKDKSE